MTDSRPCLFCRHPAVRISASPERQLFECSDVTCLAVEVIGTTSLNWWYHGAQRPDGSAIDADGRRLHRGTYGWWDNTAPPAALATIQREA